MNQVVDITALTTKEPITIIFSKMGWVRSLKVHYTGLLTITYKKGDTEKTVLEFYTTDKIIIVQKQTCYFACR